MKFGYEGVKLIGPIFKSVLRTKGEIESVMIIKSCLKGNMNVYNECQILKSNRQYNCVQRMSNLK